MSQSIQDIRPTIRKGEQCMSCVNKAQDEETDEGTIIICSLEQKQLGINELPFDPSIRECPSWLLNPEASYVSLDGEEPEDPASIPVETPELKLAFVYRGDSLVRLDEKLIEGRDGVLWLTTSFVEKYNAYVQLSRQEVEQRIDDLRAALTDKLNGIKDEVKQYGDAVDVDSLFMTPLMPDDESFIDEEGAIEGEAQIVDDVMLLEDGEEDDDFEYEEDDDLDPDVIELAKKAEEAETAEEDEDEE